VRRDSPRRAVAGSAELVEDELSSIGAEGRVNGDRVLHGRIRSVSMQTGQQTVRKR
jgi:hypothetical protein